jgi:hypothetical protein
MREIDPKIFGPGTWITTHVYALVCEQAGRKIDYREFSSYLYRMIHALPCGKCRRHAVKYLDRHPLDKFIFNWTVDFHNAVNLRLKKPLMTYEEARGIYENTEVILKDKVRGTTCTLNAGPGGCEDEPLISHSELPNSQPLAKARGARSQTRGIDHSRSAVEARITHGRSTWSYHHS